MGQNSTPRASASANPRWEVAWFTREFPTALEERHSASTSREARHAGLSDIR